MAVSVEIAGIDRSQFIAPLTQLGFSRPAGGRGVATFTLLVPSGSFEPAIGQNVVLMDGSRKAFTGTLNDFKKTRLGNLGGFSYDCSCVSLEQRLDKRLITAEYFNLTPGQIVLAILSSIPEEIIAVGQIDVTIGPPVTAIFSSTRVSDIFDQMAALANATWFCSDDLGLFYFVGRSTFNAPWDFTEVEAVRYDSDDQVIVERNRTDFRNRQRVRFAFTALPPEREVMTGDGSTNLFPTSRPISSAVKLFLTTSVQASVSGTFGGLPNPGDTISISSGTDTVTYFWRSQLNNLTPREILIGATAAQCAANFVAAVNNAGLGTLWSLDTRGKSYSWPTPTNPYCKAVDAGGGAVTLLARDPGAAGNSITVSEACSGFSWGAGSLSSGSDGTTTELSIGVVNVDTGKDWYFGPGNPDILTSGAVPNVGEFLLLQYYPVGGDVVTVEDTASVSARSAIEFGSGIYENLVDDSQNNDWNSAFQEAVGYQTAYGALLEQLTVQTDRDGITAGMLQKFNLPSMGIVNLWYFIQQVDATYLGGPNFRYTLTAISSTRIGTWLQFWAQMAKSSGGGGASGITGVGAVVTPPGLVTEVFFNLTIASNHVAIELNNGRKLKLTLNQATRVTIDNPTRGGTAPTPGDWFTLYIIQDGTGGRPTPAWGAAFGSDVANETLVPDQNTRSAYQLSLHDDGLWHLDADITTGKPLT